MVLLIVPKKYYVIDDIRKLYTNGNRFRIDEMVFDFLGLIKKIDVKCALRCIVVTVKDAWDVDEDIGDEQYIVDKAINSVSRAEIDNMLKDIVSKLSQKLSIVVATYSPFYIPWGPADITDVENLVSIWINKEVFKNITCESLIADKILRITSIEYLEIPIIHKPFIDLLIEIRELEEIYNGYYRKLG